MKLSILDFDSQDNFELYYILTAENSVMITDLQFFDSWLWIVLDFLDVSLRLRFMRLRDFEILEILL